MKRALLALTGLLIASPALAQGNQPSETASTGLGREAWLAECSRRLQATPGADPTLAPGACLHWWAYYEGGGAPDPAHGYVVPISVTQTERHCETIAQRRIIRRRVIHDKRVKL